MIHKVLRVFGFLIDSITILLFQTILVFSLFSENVRLNISALVSALLSNGVIGLYVLIILTNMFFPNFKLWYFIYQEKTLNMHVLQKTMTTSNTEKKISKWVYVYLPVLVLVYVYLRSYQL